MVDINNEWLHIHTVGLKSVLSEILASNSPVSAATTNTAQSACDVHGINVHEGIMTAQGINDGAAEFGGSRLPQNNVNGNTTSLMYYLESV